MKTVLVTGANGHLGFMLTRRLVERGFSARAAVRDVAAPEKTRRLHDLGADVVQADVLRERELDAAVAGVHTVFHVAAVHAIADTCAFERIYRPIVTGTAHVLASCARAGVSRVVMTSSAAAVGTVPPGASARDESSWNDWTRDPYLQAKIDAERLAWQFARERGLDLVTILPSAMVGPGFHRHTPTTRFLEDIVLGKVPFLLPLSLDLVDVRDVADAHVAAAENPRAHGRYVASNAFVTMRDLYEALRAQGSPVKLPRFAVPRALLGMICGLDWLRTRLAGGPRSLTRAVARDYGLREPRFSNKRIISELGWRPRPIEQSLRDTLAWMKAVLPRAENTWNWTSNTPST